MLSKSAAKAFFLGGTGICGAAFLLLTFDTMGQLNSRSHNENLTPAVKHGFKIWTDNNCMGCHSLMGEGGYYAPELTKVVERRGEVWIRAFLKDPAAMYPDRRKMVKYDFFDPNEDKDAEKNISDVIAFFDWVGKIDLNDFPPKPELGIDNNPPAKDPREGAPAVFSICSGCHKLGGIGGVVGPALDGVGRRFTAEELHKWLKNPSIIKPGTKMPNLGLADDVINDLVIFLEKQE